MSGEEPTGGPKQRTKPFEIPKRLVYEAWKLVQANDGAPGVDAASIDRFAERERDNLYKLWNRMSSGSYMPAPVRAVEIPKVSALTESRAFCSSKVALEGRAPGRR